jgi:mannose-6-phosphate isomerase-like protein (cupin superfamily)
MTLNTKNYIEQDYFQQLILQMDNGMALFRWQQPAKYYFLKALFRHSFDVCFYAENSSAVFVVDSQLYNIKKGDSIVIRAGANYGFRGTQHGFNAMICLAPQGAERDWLAVAAQL